MAPSGSKMATRTRRNLPTLKVKKKTMKETKKKQIPVIENDGEDEGGCSTPKAERNRIPEIVTCPPAPKKQRAVSDCSFRRSPIAFFAPPELELFFVYALPDISV